MSYRKRFAKRFACFVVAGVLVLGMVEPPRAKAVGSVAALYQVTSAFLASCGLGWSVSGMDSSGFTNEVGRMLEEYLNTEFAGMTPLEWSAGIACTMTGTGKVTIPKVLAEKMAQFAHWVVEKYQLVAGGDSAQVVAGDFSVTLSDGRTVQFGLTTYEMDRSPVGTLFYVSDIIKNLPYSITFSCGDGVRFIELVDAIYGGVPTTMLSYQSLYDGGIHSGSISMRPLTLCPAFTFLYDEQSNGIRFAPVSVDTKGNYYVDRSYRSFEFCNMAHASVVRPNIALNPAADIAIPNTGSMTEDEELAISTGLGATTLDGLLQKILEAILAGNLDATQEIVKAEEGAVADEAVGDTTIEGIKKEEAALGAIFLSKFPFSIPWDVARAVRLLAAPAKTPRWEVDLLAPVEYRFGKFPGDTTIVIDMSEYPAVGHFCRWMSTFLFVWALMLGTKRLIWTA